jgi:hypothetical protein
MGVAHSRSFIAAFFLTDVSGKACAPWFWSASCVYVCRNLKEKFLCIKQL